MKQTIYVVNHAPGGWTALPVGEKFAVSELGVSSLFIRLSDITALVTWFFDDGTRTESLPTAPNELVRVQTLGATHMLVEGAASVAYLKSEEVVERMSVDEMVERCGLGPRD